MNEKKGIQGGERMKGRKREDRAHFLGKVKEKEK